VVAEEGASCQAPESLGWYCRTVSDPGAEGNAAKYNGFAIASLVLGIFVFLLITSVVAIILGLVALRQIKHSEVAQKGRWMAIAGITFGFFWIGVFILLALALASPTL
jgi:hypothetical protein